MSRRWSERETRFLLKQYPEHGTAWCAERLGRSYSSVACKASSTGLSSKTKWTEWEELVLKTCYEENGAKWCAARIGKSVDVVRWHARQLGIRANKEPWSADEERFLVENAPKMTKREIGQRLGRSELAVFKRLHEIRRRA